MLLTIIEISGITVAAFPGIMEAKRNAMDLIGIYTVAFITALRLLSVKFDITLPIEKNRSTNF